MMRRLAVLLAVCTAVASSALPQRALAEIDADAGSANGIAQCGMLYSAGHDPSGLWSRLNSNTPPPIRIVTTHVPTDGTGTKTSDTDDGIQIYWDPSHDVVKPTDLNGGQLVSTPCEVLYHELQHAADDADDVPDSVLDYSCSANGTGKNGIPNAEWRAMAAENAYRASFGLPPRTSYNGTPFGPGTFEDCKKTTRHQDPRTNPPTRCSATHIWSPPTACSTTCNRSANSPRSPPATAPPPAFSSAPHRSVTPKVASLVSAVAAASGNQRIAFVTKQGNLTITHSDGSNTETVIVDDGVPRDLGGGISLTAAASTDFTGRAYTVQWAEGSQLRVNDAG